MLNVANDILIKNEFKMAKLIGYDIDGVLTAGIKPVGIYVIISGRTFSEYDDIAKLLSAMAPVYIRGIGLHGDRIHSGNFKATMINFLGVTEFHEDDDIQINIINTNCPNCRVIKE